MAGRIPQVPASGVFVLKEKQAQIKLAEWQANAPVGNVEIISQVGSTGDETLVARCGKRIKRLSAEPYEVQPCDSSSVMAHV